VPRPSPLPPLTLDAVRRFVLDRQLLRGATLPDPEPVMGVVRRIGHLQIDPTAVVARTHLLVLWSRLGRYDPADVERLLWRDRRLFEHQAFIHAVEDWPLLAAFMAKFPDPGTARGRLIREWMATNQRMASAVIDRLEREGPLPSSAIEDTSVRDWKSSGWSDRRNVSRMLEILAAQGRVIVGGRSAGQRVWDLPDRFLPPDIPRAPLPLVDAVRAKVERGIRELGVASRQDLRRYRISSEPDPLPELLAAGRVEHVTVTDLEGDRFVHVEDLAALERAVTAGRTAHTTLLSPFDNLIANRERTEALFGFRYRMEFYVPAAKREYGYFVMPILHGDALIGRVDPVFERSRGVLVVKAVYAEPDAPADRATIGAIGQALEDLSAFLGGGAVEISGPGPTGWTGLGS
jgi:uncharacterized protein YcaQ